MIFNAIGDYNPLSALDRLGPIKGNFADCWKTRGLLFQNLGTAQCCGAQTGNSPPSPVRLTVQLTVCRQTLPFQIPIAKRLRQPH